MASCSENGEQLAGAGDSLSPSTGFEFDFAQFKTDLNGCLKSIRSSGSLDIFRRLENPRDPRIHLKIGGSINLPLSDEDMQKNVSKVWEVPLGDFQLQNPKWERHLKRVVNNACASLGVYMSRDSREPKQLLQTRSPVISAELSSLTLLEDGSAFESNQDLVNPPGTFGKLVIFFNSKPSSSDVTVTDSEKNTVLDSHFLAWFSDGSHDCKVLLTGHRMVLEYKLVHTEPDSTILVEKNENVTQTDRLHSLLSTWKNNTWNERFPQALGYLFEQYYPEFEHNQTLQGHDHHAVFHLKQICQQYGFSLYVGHLEMEIAGVCMERNATNVDDGEGSVKKHASFYTFKDEIYRATFLNAIHNLDGTEIDQLLEFDEDLLTQHDPFQGVDPDEEEDEVFFREEQAEINGDGNVLMTHFYRRTVAIIIPKARRIEFFISPYLDTASESYQFSDRGSRKPGNVASLIQELSDDLSRSPGDAKILNGLEQICTLVIRRSLELKASEDPNRNTDNTPFFSEQIRIRILSTCVDINSKELFLEAYDLCPDELPLASFPAFRTIGVAVLRFKLHSILSKLTARFVVQNPHRHLSDRLDIIQSIWTGVNEEALRLNLQLDDIHKDWIGTAIYSVVSYNKSSLRTETPQYGYALAKCFKILASLSSEDTINKLLPILKNKAQSPYVTQGFITFLASIFDDRTAGALPLHLSKRLFLDIMPGFASEFSLEPPRLGSYPGAETELMESFLEVFSRCYQFGLLDELHIIALRLVSEVMDDHFQVGKFDTYILPLLKRLMGLCLGKDIALPDSPLQSLSQGLLPIYIDAFVGDEPEPPTDWTRPEIFTYCSCQDHKTFNSFLKNPDQKVGRFVFSKDRRDHIQFEVDKTGFYQDLDRTGRTYALIVIKDHQKHFEADHKAWEERKEIATAKIKDLAPEADLRILLQDLYESVTTASIARSESAVGAGGSPFVATRSKAPKRKTPDRNDYGSVASEDGEDGEDYL
ncbi:hypothetical protein BKA65DRAFT_597937 [Rhexocercosporidium sp. MPI-PUGE-AT-0058]|nr:hypothetical protein BKA65DRAFT_597937 [Rhexocercosporidium sp. MPI-PUGE-AT-0058]